MVFVLYFYYLFYYLFLVILLKKKVCIYDFSFFFFWGVLFFKFCFRLRLEGGNGMKWKEMKKIILEYSSIPLFGSFNGGNRKLIPLFGSLSRREWNGQKGTLILLYSLKTSNFHSPRNWEVQEGMELDLIIFLLKLPKYPYIFNSLF